MPSYSVHVSRRREWGSSALSRARQRLEAPEAIRGALRAAGGSISLAAKMLGVARSYLYVVAVAEGLSLRDEALNARRHLATQPTA